MVLKLLLTSAHFALYNIFNIVTFLHQIIIKSKTDKHYNVYKLVYYYYQYTTVNRNQILLIRIREAYVISGDTVALIFTMGCLFNPLISFYLFYDKIINYDN